MHSAKRHCSSLSWPLSSSASASTVKVSGIGSQRLDLDNNQAACLLVRQLGCYWLARLLQAYLISSTFVSGQKGQLCKSFGLRPCVSRETHVTARARWESML